MNPDGDGQTDGTRDWGDGMNIDGDIDNDGTQDWGDGSNMPSSPIDGDIDGDGEQDWGNDQIFPPGLNSRDNGMGFNYSNIKYVRFINRLNGAIPFKIRIDDASDPDYINMNPGDHVDVSYKSERHTLHYYTEPNHHIQVIDLNNGNESDDLQESGSTDGQWMYNSKANSWTNVIDFRAGGLHTANDVDGIAGWGNAQIRPYYDANSMYVDGDINALNTIFVYIETILV